MKWFWAVLSLLPLQCKHQPIRGIHPSVTRPTICLSVRDGMWMQGSGRYSRGSDHLYSNEAARVDAFPCRAAPVPRLFFGVHTEPRDNRQLQSITSPVSRFILFKRAWKALFFHKLSSIHFTPLRNHTSAEPVHLKAEWGLIRWNSQSSVQLSWRFVLIDALIFFLCCN